MQGTSNQPESMTPSQSRFSKKILTTLLVLGGVFLFAGGVLVGQFFGIRSELFSDSGEIKIEKVLNLYSKTRSPDVSFDQYWEVWDAVKEKYVNQPIDDVDLFYGSLKGLVEGLDDPYSIYLPPTDAKEFAQDLAGEFEGIGAEIGIRDGQLTIVAPLPGSPAQIAGLTPGDKIFAIDTVDTRDMSLEQAVTHIRGKKGTIVTLTVSQNGPETIRDVDVVRDTITVPTVDWELLDDSRIAYVQVRYFNEETWTEFDRIIRDILDANPEGLVLDLRSNPGGFLQTSVDVASEWVERGSIVSEEFTGGDTNEYASRGAHRLANMPTIVLIDGGTASGSEIVAGALQDHGKATIVGQQSFGKGSVQDFEFFADGSALKLTIAKWFTPDGRAIDGTGITPDIVLDDMFVQVGADDSEPEIVDKGIEKAIELLK